MNLSAIRKKILSVLLLCKNMKFSTLNTLWQLPQFILTLINILFMRKSIIRIEKLGDRTSVVYFTSKIISSFSLGQFIFINVESKHAYKYADDKESNYLKKLEHTIRHEGGHSRQSFYLGWLYLPIVGVPSVILNILSRYNKKINRNYYNYFPENWANKLGGVDAYNLNRKSKDWETQK